MSGLNLDGATIALINYTTGTCVDLPDGSENYKQLVGTKFQNLDSQLWKIEVADKSTVWPLFKLQNVKWNRYADLKNGDAKDGAVIHGFDKTATNNQLWRFVSADPLGRVIMIQNYGTGTFFDLDSGNGADGTLIQGWEGNTHIQNTHQWWRVLRIN
ncbi:carbohydrate-binding module family 13 protein [Xylariaceae sp. FL0594]|nr:carbohydrate-binding module family 13 protein [Xylariaceae sp. FL0594]